MKFMNAEGDRSGVATPSKDEKARNRLKAVLLHLEEIERHWGTSTPQRLATAVSEQRHSLAAVVTLLMGGDANT